ncbi:MAG: hypothetical protein KDJ19_11200 [Hyphomicrobiaceae bacterium]|nr:hypothetical protein [Hyphomicrobiaceae bacterium]MCC0024211.1 hypothetical protein [Hyphomicrobiaceae bacterium]
MAVAAPAFAQQDQAVPGPEASPPAATPAGDIPADVSATEVSAGETGANVQGNAETADGQAMSDAPDGDADASAPQKPSWQPFGSAPVIEDPVNLDTPLIGPYLTDALTGVALSGYDPVSYFTAGEPQMGSSELEFYWQGVSWYFASLANLENFRRAPEFYAPQFGGHGAMSMARGYLSQGDPQIYLVLDDELFLFYSAGNKIAFQEIVNSARLDARQNWARLRDGLVLR